MKPENMVNMIRQMTSTPQGDSAMNDPSVMDGIFKNVNMKKDGGPLL
jgi:hypothetical protein